MVWFVMNLSLPSAREQMKITTTHFIQMVYNFPSNKYRHLLHNFTEAIKIVIKLL